MVNYSFDMDDLGEVFATIFSSAALVTVFIVVFAIIALFALAVYIFSCIGLYRMAKKLECDKAWMAWIPFANTWLMFNLPRNEYRVLALNKVIENRTNAFLIHLAIQYGTNTVIGILSAIPIIGYLVAAISPLVGIAVTVAYIFMIFPVYKDLYKMFLPDNTAQTYAIVSIVCHFLVPIVPAILMFVASGKDPVEVVDASY